MIMKGNSVKVSVMLVFFQLVVIGCKAQSGHQHQHTDSSSYQLPNGQYSNIPHQTHQEPLGDFTLPPEAYMNIDFDSEHDTKIYGKVKRTDGVDSTVFYLKKEPLPDKERILKEGSEFLLLNVLLSPKRVWNKILIRVLSNPPTNKFVGDTGWVEVSHTTLYPYYDN